MSSLGIHRGAADMARDGIFVSVAAYRDPLLEFTLRSALTQASRPERVVLGVVEQQMPEQFIADRECWAPHLRRLQIPALQSRGACWARALAMSLWQGERWFLQVDSHTWFEPGWDERLVEWGLHCQGINEHCILSTYPDGFRFVNGHPAATSAGGHVLAQVVRSGQDLLGDHPVLMFDGVPVDSESPVPGFHVGAGFIFAPGAIVNELPYDPYLYFHGEEQALALRAWTHGWDIFHPPRVPLYHHYITAAQTERPLHWSPDLDAQRRSNAAELTRLSNARLARLVWSDEDLGAFGLGRVRSLAEYAAFSGIDYQNRSIAQHSFKRRYGYA